MTSKTKIISIITAATLVLASCQKPVDDVPPTPPPAAPRVSKITYTHQTVSYGYNPDGTLKELLINENNSTQGRKYTFSYEAGKIKESRAEDFRLDYSYPNPSTTRIELRNRTAQIRYSFDFKVNGDRLLEWTQYGHGTGAPRPDSKVVHTYNSAGNIALSEHFEFVAGGWQKFEAVRVEYDDKPNFSSHLEHLFYYLGPLRLLANNPVKETHSGADGLVYKTVTYQHSFDAAGRKICSLKKTVEDGVPEQNETITFDY